MEKPNVKWPNGQTEFYKAIFKHRAILLDGHFVVIDPASGSSSSPGFAIFKQGIRTASGSIKVPNSKEVQPRLHYIYDELQKITADPPDLLILEKLRGAMVPASLWFAAGTTIAAIRTPRMVEMPICVWRAYAGKSYTDAKTQGSTTDEEDAVMMGLAAIHLAVWGKE